MLRDVWEEEADVGVFTVLRVFSEAIVFKETGLECV